VSRPVFLSSTLLGGALALVGLYELTPLKEMDG
jgi:hypothetical protein